MPDTENTKREGPLVQLKMQCDGCRYLHSEYYAVQDDWGFDYTCTHVDAPKPPRIPYASQTPNWCPFRGVSIEAFVEEISHA